MTSLQILDPCHPYALDPTVAVRVELIVGHEVRAQVQACLLKAFPGDAPVEVSEGGRRIGDSIVGDIAALPDGVSLFVPPISGERAVRSIVGARQIVARLRGPNGCPWDREQTPESLLRYVIEEAYEVAEAVRVGDPDKIADELGDVLLQVLLQAEIASETGQFTLEDVFEHLSNKLVRRHPHVFADLQLGSADEVLLNWAKLKQQETGRTDSVLDGVGRGLPALIAAQELQRRAASAGFDPNGEWITGKLSEELAELAEARTLTELEHELGDVLFILARLGLSQGVDAELALHAANARVIERFRFVEARLAERGQKIADAPFDEILEFWRAAKAAERQVRE